MRRRKDGWKRAKELCLRDKLITPSGVVDIQKLKVMGGMMGETDVEVTVTDFSRNRDIFTYDWNAKVRVK